MHSMFTLEVITNVLEHACRWQQVIQAYHDILSHSRYSVVTTRGSAENVPRFIASIRSLATG